MSISRPIVRGSMRSSAASVFRLARNASGHRDAARGRRSARFAWLCSPGSRSARRRAGAAMPRMSRTSASTPRLNSARAAETSSDSATIAWPVLVGVRVVVVEVDDVAAHRRAVQRAGEQAEDQRQAVALVAADRQQEAFVRALRIGQRIARGGRSSSPRASSRRAGPWSSPCRRPRPSSPCRARSAALPAAGTATAIGLVGAACRARPRAADGWRCRRRIEADHVVLDRHHRVERGRARHDCSLRRRPTPRPRVRAFAIACSVGEAHDEVAHAVVAVDQRHARPLPLDADVRPMLTAPP